MKNSNSYWKEVRGMGDNIPTAEHFATAERNGLSKQNVRSRLHLDWSIERAITEPKMSPSEAGRRGRAGNKYRFDIKRG